MEVLEAYNYILPKYAIAKYPPPRRGTTNLMVYFTATDNIVFTKYHQLYRFLPSNSILVRNVTKVVKARLLIPLKYSRKPLEILLLPDERPFPPKTLKFNALIRYPNRRSRRQNIFKIKNWKLRINKIPETRFFSVEFIPKSSTGNIGKNFVNLLQQYGKVPIPPYLRREAQRSDAIRYNPIFSKIPGAVAAPTASLNFTHGLQNRLHQKGINFVDIVLHVGFGTFAPITTENIIKNKLHSETVHVSSTVRRQLEAAKTNNIPITAVGTTVVRALESLQKFNIEKFQTDLFIRPPFKFQMTDILLTNFHMPRSSLLMLVDAFLQYKKSAKSWKELYKLALHKKFRFLSYGDSMLII